MKVLLDCVDPSGEGSLGALSLQQVTVVGKLTVNFNHTAMLQKAVQQQLALHIPCILISHHLAYQHLELLYQMI